MYVGFYGQSLSSSKCIFSAQPGNTLYFNFLQFNKRRILFDEALIYYVRILHFQVLDEYQKNFGETWRSAQSDSTQQWPYLNEALTKFQVPILLPISIDLQFILNNFLG